MKKRRIIPIIVSLLSCFPLVLLASSHERHLNIKERILDKRDRVIKEITTLSPSNATLLGYKQRITQFDGQGLRTKVEETYHPQQSEQTGYARTVYNYKKGRKTKVERFFTKSVISETGVVKSVVHLDSDGLKDNVEMYYTPREAEKSGFIKSIFHFHRDGRRTMEEFVYNSKKSAATGIARTQIAYDLNNKKSSETLVMSKEYLLKTGVIKVVRKFDEFGNELAQVGHFTESQAELQGYHKTAVYHDKNGAIIKEERYYSSSARGHYKGVIYYENGRPLAEVRVDGYGRRY